MMSFESGNLVFHDSLNFFKIALENLPATFNLQEMHKGYFPHRFNRVENYSYRSVHPPAVEYEPDQMLEKKRKAFLTWHAEKIRGGAIFDFQEELSEYCKSDVKLLKEGCLKFCRKMETLAEFNPLTSTGRHDCQYDVSFTAEKLSGGGVDCVGTAKWVAKQSSESESGGVGVVGI